MNSKTRSSCRRVATLALALSLTAIANVGMSQDNVARTAAEYRIEDLNYEPISETLDLTYRILGKGNRNYCGHRIRAMAKIKEAATLLGVELPAGEKGGDEDQAKSDARLSVSQRLLEQLRHRLPEEDQKEALGQIEAAIKHLRLALKIRAAVEEIESEQSASPP